MANSGGHGSTGKRLGRLLSSISMVGIACSAPMGFNGHPFAGKPAAAAIGGDELFSELTPMTRAELSQERGGFKVSGFDISVGVSVETVVDGFVKVSTNFSIGDAGKVTHIGTDVKTYTSQGDFMPNVDDIVARAKPDVGGIIDRVFDAADAGKKDRNNVDPEAVAAGAASAAVVEAADLLVKAADAVPREPASASDGPAGKSEASSVFAGGGTQASAPAKTTSAQTPKMPVNSTLFDGEALSGGSKPEKVAKMPKDVATTTIKTSPKAKASATVAPQATVAASSGSGSSVNVADLEGATGSSGGQTAILHQVGDGHLSLIENSMNNITVKQSTRINLTVENFIKNQGMVRLQKSLENTARLAGIAGLRR